MLVYLYFSIDFCQKSKEQRLKFTKNAYNVAKILTIIVILQNYFRKLSFLKKEFVRSFLRTKINSMFHIIFAKTAVETLAGIATCGERGGRAGSSYELDAARSIQSKFISHILALPGGCLRAFQIPFFVSCNEKRHIK
jgi:hypothetical protein